MHETREVAARRSVFTEFELVTCLEGGYKVLTTYVTYQKCDTLWVKTHR